MVAGVIDEDPAALTDRKTARTRKERVSQIILGSSRGRIAELHRPPWAGRARPGHEQADAAAALHLRLRLPGGETERRLTIEEAGQLAAERVDASFQALIEHVADHDHAASRPLSHAAEIGIVKLRLASIAPRQRVKQGGHGLDADPVALGDLGGYAKPVGREVVHGRSFPEWSQANERSLSAGTPLRRDPLYQMRLIATTRRSDDAEIICFHGCRLPTLGRDHCAWSHFFSRRPPLGGDRACSAQVFLLPLSGDKLTT